MTSIMLEVDLSGTHSRGIFLNSHPRSAVISYLICYFGFPNDPMPSPRNQKTIDHHGEEQTAAK